MVLYNFMLIITVAASAACFYYYTREKRLLREFKQHSRRHSYHKDIDTARQQKASRYLTLSLVLSFIALPLLAQNFVEGFIEKNWIGIVTFLSLPVIFLSYKNITGRKIRSAKPFSFSMSRNGTDQ